LGERRDEVELGEGRQELKPVKRWEDIEICEEVKKQIG
jgi:hypothetical protein